MSIEGDVSNSRAPVLNPDLSGRSAMCIETHYLRGSGIPGHGIPSDLPDRTTIRIGSTC